MGEEGDTWRGDNRLRQEHLEGKGKEDESHERETAVQCTIWRDD